jgi:hypothetical protein
MASRGQPGEGQLGFDGSVVPPMSAVDPERPGNALARTLTLEYMDLDSADFTDVTASMLEYVRPDKLRPHLIDVPFDGTVSPMAVSYTDRQTLEERNVAVTPQEAQLLPRFMNAFQRSAAVKSRAKVTTHLPSDADIARAERSKVHIQETKLPAVTKYYAMLQTQRSLLDKFIVASSGRNVGFSMFGKEGTARERFAYLQTYIIGDMVRAYGTQRGLTSADMRMVDKAITMNIFYHHNKADNFHDLVQFLREYNGHKLELAGQRVDSMERNIGRVGVQTA